MTGSPRIADFRCWTWPKVAILGADQNVSRKVISISEISAVNFMVDFENTSEK